VPALCSRRVSQMFAIASAALYGVADFSGGLASRRIPPLGVTAWSQLMGVPLLGIGVVIVSAPAVTGADLAYGAVGGLFGLVGIVCLYAALSAGTMSVVSPITGVLTAILPVVWGLVAGESIEAAKWLGILLAVTSVLLVAADRSEARVGVGVLVLSIAASIGFAAFFIALAQTSRDAGMWPLVAGRVVSIPVAFAVAAVAGVIAHPRGGTAGIVAIAGNGDIAANLAVLIALQSGPLGINTVLVSLYPAVTAVTAMVVLGERPTGPQRVGIVMALIAAAILAW
jgi:drug/metabolite transporter (DMT)-like permease